MDVVTKYLIIAKHYTLKKGKQGRRRRFYEIDELDKALEHARNLADENKRDFLVVRVVEEKSKLSVI